MRIRLALKVLKDWTANDFWNTRYTYGQFIKSMKRLMYHKRRDTRAKRICKKKASEWRISAYRMAIDKKETE